MNLVVETACRNVAEVASFYSKLGFEKEVEEKAVYYVSKDLVVSVNDKNSARTGLVFYMKKEEISELVSSEFNIKDGESYIISAPSGTRVILKEGTLPVWENIRVPSELGNYCGISIETINLASSKVFWSKLGFQKTMGDASQGWISMKNREGVVISLMAINMCPHIFTNPSLTFFNGKENPKIIEKVRSLDLPIAEEITVFNDQGIVDNIVLRDPGELGMFIFNDEV